MHGQQAQPVEQVSRVIQLIYGCALDPQQWRTTLAAIIALTNSAAAVLSVHSGRARYVFHHGYEPPDDQRFPALQPAFSWKALCVGDVVTQGVPINDVKFLNSCFYKEWC